MIDEFLKQQQAEKDRHLADNSATTDQFTQFLASVGIDPSGVTYDYAHTIGITANFPGLVAKLLSWTAIDDEGLYAVKTLLSKLAPPKNITGHLFSGNYSAMFTPFFRRGYCPQNNWAPHFARLFGSHIGDKNKDCYICLDPDRVRINMDGSQYMEFDYWYGPKFKGEIEAIKNGCVKHSIPADISKFAANLFFHDVQTLDMAWATKGNLRTFQAMEFKSDHITIDRGGSIKHPVRYLHSEYDLVKKCFSHVDGAMQFMTPDEFDVRKNDDFNYKAKGSTHVKAEYMKLFKINGAVSVAEWIDLVSHFFHGNPLVHEYFTGSLPEGMSEKLARMKISGF